MLDVINWTFKHNSQLTQKNCINLDISFDFPNILQNEKKTQPPRVAPHTPVAPLEKHRTNMNPQNKKIIDILKKLNSVI